VDGQEMNELLFLLLFLLATFSILLIIFSKPLTEDQISKLALKRRNRRIIQYFSGMRGYYPSKQFKSGLKPNGKLYQIDLDMPYVPSFVANLLKYKKHEWSVIAFIGNRKAKYIWVNKGPDRSQVPLLSVDLIIKTAKNNDCDVIMAFHNHPAHDPQHYSYHRPSEMDFQAAERFSQMLNAIKISYVDHVCERGMPYRYCLKPSETLHPLRTIQEETKTENMQGRMTHIKLHFELYF
jgi:hypothetical protein